MMIRTITCRFATGVLLGAAVAGTAVASDFLSVAANAPAAPLAPRDPGRNLVRLPMLEYEFEIHTHCYGNRSPESLSLNVADSRTSLPASQIVSDGPTEFSLRIPASQIAPLMVENFCVVQQEENGDEPSDVPAQITIPAALSAQASLLCAGDEDRVITYVSKALDVSLVCDRAVVEQESADE